MNKTMTMYEAQPTVRSEKYLAAKKALYKFLASTELTNGEVVVLLEVIKLEIIARSYE